MERVRAIFLSDAHLAWPEDDNYARMLAFLGRLRDLPDLFILGDFFAFWMGFARVPARYRPAVEALRTLVEGGTRLHYVEGNHDIDVGRYFARRLGARVHPERAEVELAGKRLLLVHGDTVDRADRGYRFLRAFLRSVPMKGLSRAVPPEGVLAIARRFAEHKDYGVTRNTRLPPLLEGFARERWAEGYDGVLMGHCHVPAFVEKDVAGRSCFYANLGDWVEHYTYVVFDGDRFALETVT